MVRIFVEAALPPGFPLNRSELKPLLTTIQESLGLERASYNLRLVNDAEIARLNQQYLGCVGPTNVLSFPADDDTDAEWRDALDDLPDELHAALESLQTQALPDSGPDSSTEAELGGIALSVDTLVREVFLYGQDPAEHLSRLLAHALLHLSGLDHSPEMDALTEAAVTAATEHVAGRTE